MSNEEVEQLKLLVRKRGYLKGIITKTCKSISSLQDLAGLSKEILITKEERLRSNFEKYDILNLEIAALDPNDSEIEDAVEEKYIRSLALVKESINKFVSGSKDTNVTSHMPLKLPTINVPIFTGNYSEYKTFLSLFTSLIHNNTAIDQVQKLYYLRNFLQGEPLNLILNLPFNEFSYKEALQLLNERYDNVYKITNEHIHTILDISPIVKSTSITLRKFVSIVKQELAALKNLNYEVEAWDPVILCILIRKLDLYTNKEFQILRDSSSNPSVKQLIIFLERRALALENVEGYQRTAMLPINKAVHVTAVKEEVNDTASQFYTSCPYCKYSHKLFTCAKFKLATVADRIRFISENNLCQICLNNHRQQCRLYFKCKICKGKHNTLLHEEPSIAPVTLVPRNIDTQVLLPTVRIKLLNKNNKEFHIKALLDSGSQASFITSELIELLELKPTNLNTGVMGIGNKISSVNQCVQLTVHSTANSYQLPVTFHIIDNITSNLPQQQIDLKKIKLPPGLQLADKDFNIPSRIQMLLGANVFFQVLLPLDPIITIQNLPFIINTQFGYVIAGSLPIEPVQKINQLVSNFCQTCNTSIADIISNFWKTEAVLESYPEKNSEHTSCEILFKQSVEVQNHQFQVSLPLKIPIEEVNETLGDSFSLALKRFYNLENKFGKNPGLFQSYQAFIHEYISLGHASQIDINQYNFSKDPLYFLPHHAVLRPDKQTTKCRVVFDGSMKTSKRVSLNDIMLNGPFVQQELFDILILFRLGKYFFMTDIKHMFRAVYVHPKYRSLQNILWRDSPQDNIQCFQLNTITYGLKSSPYLATRCLIELADMYLKEYPLASFILKNLTYMDDSLVSEQSLDTIIEMKKQLVEVLNLGGFQLHKWTSNSSHILQDLPKNLLHYDEVELNKNEFYLKTLGVSFNIKNDLFKIAAPINGNSLPTTKRQILSFISQIYDPLGLAGPIITSAKAIMQKLWTNKVGWDCFPSEELTKLWQEFYDSLTIMKPINIERQVVMDESVRLELIGYADASSSVAHGCCIYIRSIDTSDNIKVSLLCSKSRINPLKPNITVPRLELNAALLLSKLMFRVHNTLKLKTNINRVILYSDSQIVLAWLRTEIIKLNTYVANRVKVIKELTATFTWSYICSNDNPADILSRGIKPHMLQHEEIWWNGPRSLQNNECPIINNTEHQSVLPELKADYINIMTCTVSQNKVINLTFLHKFSNINKMQRILSYVLKFCNNALRKNVIKLKYLTSHELNEALLLIVYYEQQMHFKAEINAIVNRKTIPGCLQNLNPFIDDKGLLRVGGRLQLASIQFAQKHPIILPKESRVTELIVQNEHLKYLHAGSKIILASINQRFWLVNGINFIKKIIYKCIVCHRFKAVVSEQLMGSLPTDRVNISRPFQKVGIDFAGPISIKQSRVRKSLVTKGYIAVYVCFVTKAVHLELVSDLSTGTFLACFNRFISRRGLPSDVYCDNASTFKCARNQLNALYNLHSSTSHQIQVQCHVVEKGINFHFIPSYSPVFGGLWEAAVKSTKFHLKRIVQKSLLTFEEMYTVLTQIEAVLNSRPLTPMSVDINDFTYLTPGHFLIGTALNTYPEPCLSQIPVNRLKFWKVCVHMQQSFWKVWSNQYLNILQNRPKWRKDMPNMKEGSLVLLRDKNTSPMHWPMARVLKVLPGLDNKVRVIEVKTPNGKIQKRSITTVCLLPIEM